MFDGKKEAAEIYLVALFEVNAALLLQLYGRG